MNHSKRGLNEPFYKWLDDVRRAIRKEKELQEKLQYYNVKLIGYKGVVYDRIGSSSTSPSEKDLLYWIDKINQTEITLTMVIPIIDGCNRFLMVLTNQEREVFCVSYLSQKTCPPSINLSKVDQSSIKIRIIHKWFAKHK